MRSIIPAAATRSRSMMVAVVLGTALSGGEGRASSAASRVSTAGGSRSAPRNDHAPDVVQVAAPETVRDITRYCQVCWRNARLPADRWDDCTQQVFTRLLERVAPGQWNTLLRDEADDRREFIRAIDAVKKRTQRARRTVDLPVDHGDDRNRADDSRREQRDAVDAAAREVLSSRQRKIVEMTADGWAVPDIATELRTTPERVSDEKYKAIRKLRTHLGVDSDA